MSRINARQWLHWKQTSGVYFISRAKDNMTLETLGILDYDRDDPLNRGVVSFTLVAVSSSRRSSTDSTAKPHREAFASSGGCATIWTVKPRSPNPWPNSRPSGGYGPHEVRTPIVRVAHLRRTFYRNRRICCDPGDQLKCPLPRPVYTR